MTEEIRIYNGEKRVSSKWCWENWTSTCKRMKLKHSLTHHTKINAKWIKDLNVRSEPQNHSQRRTQTEHKSQQFFFNLSPKVKKIKAKINKWDLIKPKSFVQLKKRQNKKITFRIGVNICK